MKFEYSIIMPDLLDEEGLIDALNWYGEQGYKIVRGIQTKARTILMERQVNEPPAEIRIELTEAGQAALVMNELPF